MSDRRDVTRPGQMEDRVLPVERDGASRRTFLKLVGFGVASATLSACARGPVRMVVPRLEGVEGVRPGRPLWIATTCAGCEAGCGVLARCRDGRPVKLEGNPDHPASRGGLCATGQAALLDLYDGHRLDGPLLRGESATWEAVDDVVRDALSAARGRVRVLTRTVTGPSTRAWIERLIGRYGGAHVEWDPRSASALLDAHAAAFGVRAVPRVRLERADVILGIEADFLGTWIAPVELAKLYSAGRRPDGDDPRMSRHVQMESALSLTGCAADTRIPVAPHEVRADLATLCAALAGHAGESVRLEGERQSSRGDVMRRLAAELWTARGRSVVVCGSDDAGAQALAILANRLLGSYGTTLDLERPTRSIRGDDGALRTLISELEAGEVDVLVVHGLDPVHELPESAGLRAALGRVGTIVSTAPRPDDTTPLVTAVVPAPHELESWNDAEAVSGELSLSQPAVPPLRSARTLRASLARWLGDDGDDHDLVRAHWRSAVFPRADGGSFNAFFDRALHDGHVSVRPEPGPRPRFDDARWRAFLDAAPPVAAPDAGRLALVVASQVGISESRHAHNAWLQELPDPLTTLVWENAACVAPATAERMGARSGDVVRISDADGVSIEVPLCTVPGTHEGVVVVRRGYGAAGTDRFSRIAPGWLEGRVTVRPGERVGARAEGLLALDGGGLRASGRPVAVTATGARADLAATQDHHRLEVPEHLAVPRGEVRGAVLATTLAELREDPEHAVPRHEPADVSLWPDDHPYEGPRWGMVIDLAACNGCSGCVVACQSENNVPCVGKDEVRRHREMTWLRMDRYFTGDGEDARAVHQPMMCHHCANAPCETVCPVLATVHSSDGLNQQVYNRCVGTRYCANNCPYKTRRFNWFDYPRGDELQNLALNPDVTVRSRGVMEKCSFCIQRIQEGKAEARRTGVPLADGDVQTACQQSCPADAIAFGDLNDPASAASRGAANARAYTVLAELNVRPGVSYLAKVRNRPGGTAGGRDD